MQAPDPSPAPADRTPHGLTSSEFRRRFRWLVFHSWNIPPVFGLGFILLIGVLTPAQLLGILVTPLEPAYILGWLAFAMWFLPRSMRPLTDWLDHKPGSTPEQAIQAVRRFPLLYWSLFVVYLAIAPVSVVVAAHLYTDFTASWYALFRIELVALIVSIIVGLPIFFRIFDLFGQALGGLELSRPIITVRKRVFLIGALVPLLIDTMLVQYYWTRTGYFTAETFAVWLLLEMLAIGGSLIFAHSFGQALAPLQALIGAPRPLPAEHVAALRARSTDEIGLLTKDYRLLLEDLQLQGEILELSNRLLRSTGTETGTAEVFASIVGLCRESVGADQAFLIIHDPETDSLLGVAQTGAEYRPAGHFRLALDEQSLAVTAFKGNETQIAEDARHDLRVSPQLCERYGVLSTLATPMQFGAEALGVLMVTHTGSIHHYSVRDRKMLEALAREAAIAIKTRRLQQAREQAESALRDSEQRLKRQQEALVRLAEQQVHAASDISRVYRAVTESVASVLGVRRASLWRLEAEHDELHCLDLYELAGNRHSAGHSLRQAMYPAYFAALEENRPILADDAHTAKETREFRADYLAVHGIGAMLDAPIHRAGRAIGVLCCEHVGGQRHWTTDEANFTSSVADFVSLCLELHEHHRTAGELDAHRERLEELVAARTNALEAANRELEAFSYSVSHDLRAPLRAIDGFARALTEDFGERLDDTGRNYLDRVARGAQRMGVLIDDLLQLSRVSRAEFKPLQVNLSAVVQEIAARLAEEDPVRPVSVEIQPDVMVRGDPRLLHIALTNLLDNAWKYTGKTTDARIVFGTRTQQEPWIYYVMDNGIGFDMKYVDRLFGAFQRLHGAEFPGTGVGLATVQRIVHRHGGKVWAEGRPGEGACFYFTLGP